MNAKNRRFRGKGGSGRKPFRRNKPARHPGFAEREVSAPPVPKGDIPEAFAGNAFGRLDKLIQHAVADGGYVAPTPIQEQSIPVLLSGKDLLGCAQTGTGKTAAFLLPILHRLAQDPKPIEPKHPRALILAPTRELAAQIAKNAGDYGKYLPIRYAVVFGGVGQFAQVKALEKGAQIVVATPGRLLDLMEQKYCFLDKVEEFVLDEADRMLDMGFLPDIKRIIERLPVERHSQFFSATLGKEVMALANNLVRNPETVTISPGEPTVEKIEQRLMFVEKGNKCNLLAHILQNRPELDKVLVFARTRRGADKIVKKLGAEDIKAAAIHSDKTQMMRTKALEAFRSGKTRVLVATDIASRGIDVDSVDCVFNFDMPEESESYVHRIGRTARAGASGLAISLVSAEERGLLRGVERLIGKRIEIDRNHPFHSEDAEAAAGKGGQGAPQPEWMKGRAAKDGRKKEKRERPEKKPSARGRMQGDFKQKLEDSADFPEFHRKPAPKKKAWFEEDTPKKQKDPWYAKPFRSNGHHLPGDLVRDEHQQEERERKPKKGKKVKNFHPPKKHIHDKPFHKRDNRPR